MIQNSTLIHSETLETYGSHRQICRENISFEFISIENLHEILQNLHVGI